MLSARAAQQFQDTHANRGGEAPGNFELLLGIDVEKLRMLFALDEDSIRSDCAVGLCPLLRFRFPVEHP